MRLARLASLQLAFAVAASFLGSLLLFAFEPYIGKILLPSFGGTPLLWNTCMVFFQVALFLGYAYALALTRTLGARRQLMIQLVVLGALFAVYPGAHIAPGPIPAAESPGLVLAERLTRHVLLPFVALAAVTTLVQSWLARSPAQAGRSPYRLYAASNAGSLAGLFGYPLLLEPYLSLAEQRTAMLLMLGAVILALAGLGVALRSDDTPAPSPPPEGATSPAPEPARVPSSVWLTVIGLTALPASLLLGVTNYVLTDIASVPLFWVVPLALYLTTFIIAFARRRDAPRWPLGRVFALLGAVAVVSLAAETTAPAALLLPLHLTAVFLGSLLCHLKVASLAPHPRWLPHYYLTIALGGALGGIVTLLVPPLVTDGFLEYPAALVLCTLVLGATDPVGRSWRGRAVDFMLPAVLVVAGTVALRRVLPANLEPLAAAAYLPAAVFAYSANMRGRVFTARLASLLLASLFLPSPFGRTIFAERNFYGRVRVARDLGGDFHKVVHGSTIHGMQRVSDMHRCSPASYYHPSGPAGRFLTALTPAATPRRVALIGLGSGALVCYARSGEVWDLYELNPAMARVAADRRLFTFLQGSAAAAKNVVLGDARLSLERNATARYDLLIVDAFSSDAIPIHLITKEAIASYARRLRPGGLLLFHVSNRFFRLTPVLATAGPQVRMAAFVFKDSLIAPGDRASGKYASEWVILAPEDQGQTLSGEWVRVPPSDMRVWTDDYSNPLRAMMR